MRTAWIAARKDLDRLRRDPLAMAGWLGMPLVIAVLMNLVFGGGEVRPQGRLLVADEDNTFLSGALTAAFARDPLDKMVLVEKVKREEGRARIDRGDGSALLIIPKGLQDAYLRAQPFRLQLFTNPGQSILPNIVEEALGIMVEAGFYLQKVAAPQLETFAGSAAPTDESVARISVSINRLIGSVGKFINPPLIELDTAVAEEKKPAVNFAALSLPGMLFMALMFLSNGMAVEIWKERTAGTLRRAAAAPARFGSILAGRLLYVAIILTMVAALGVGGMRWLAAVPVAHPAAAMLWLVFSGTALHLLLLAATVHASSQRAANVLGSMVVFPLVLLGGGMFPFEAMPAWMAAAGRLTPNGWALVQFRAILAGEAAATGVLMAMAGITAVGGLAFLLAARRMRRTFLV